MRQATNTRRPRSRSNGKRHPSSKNQPFESNGPEVKVRGTAQQVLEKYLALARDAYSAGDRVAAENYFQHAEHYYRIINAEQAAQPSYGQNRGERFDRTEETDEKAQSDATSPDQPASAEHETEPEPAPA